MKHKKFELSLLLLTIGITTMAQQNTTAAGGDASGSGGTVAYSIGQLVYSADEDASGTVSQGVQQAYEIFIIGVQESKLQISILVFPNPTAHNLTLQIEDYKGEKLLYQLYDMQGKSLHGGEISGHQTHINTEHLPAATYFIHVMNKGNKRLQLFKIIKN